MTSKHTKTTKPGLRAVSGAKRAVLYLRVSSQSQVDTDYDPEGNSIPAQRKACQRKAAEIGAEIVDEYVEPGRSAMTVAGRPRFQEMMARIKNARDVDMVIVYARSRIHRDGIDSAITKRDFRQAGVTLVSVMDYTEDTYIGDLVAHVIDGVNEYQSRASGADISYKMAAKAERGGTLGVARLGYLNVTETVDGHEVRTIAVDSKRAPFITMLFELYATGKHSFKALREAVTKAGLRTRPTKKNPAGTTISVGKIGTILRDRYYLGYVQYKGKEYKGRHQALISQKLFDQVQHVLDVQRGGGTKESRHNHHLKGALWCDRCGKRFIFEPGRSHTGRRYYYFACAGQKLHACDMPRLPAHLVEAEVERHYATLAIPAQAANQLRQAMDEAINSSQKSTAELRKALNNECKRLEALEDQYMELVGHPDWPQDKLTAKMRDIAIEKADLHARLAEADITELINGHKTITALLDLLNDPQAAYRSASDDTKKYFTKACFTKLFINADHHTHTPVIARDQLAKPLTPLLPATRTFAPTQRKSGAPITGGTAHAQGSKMNHVVGLTGLEPATPEPPARCATKLRHSPIVLGRPLGVNDPGYSNPSPKRPASGLTLPRLGRTLAPLLSGLDRQHDRRARETEVLPQPPLDVAQVLRIQLARGEHDELRRPHAGLGHEQHLGCLAAPDRVRVGGDQCRDPLVEFAGGDALLPAFQCRVQEGGELGDGATGGRGDVDPRRPLHPTQVAVDLAGDLEPAVLVDEVPLVERDHQRPPGFDDLGDDALVLFADGLGGVQQHDGDLGGLHGRLGAQRGVVLGAAGLLDAFAQPGGVDELPGLATEFDEAVDGVNGGARHRVDHDPVLTGEPVEQAGLADVGFADQRDPAGSALGVVVDGGQLRQRVQDDVEQVAGASAVQGRDRVRLTEAHGPQLGGVGLGANAVDLVGDQDDGLGGPVQHPRGGVVDVGGADGGVHDQDDDVAGGDGLFGLRGDGGGPADGVGFPAAGVHDGELAAVPLRVIGDPVAGDAGDILDDGLPAPDQPVDQSGLADVGSPDDGHDGYRAGVGVGVGIAEVVERGLGAHVVPPRVMSS